MLKASLGRRGAEADFPLSREQLNGTSAGTAAGTVRRNRSPGQPGTIPMRRAPSPWQFALTIRP